MTLFARRRAARNRDSPAIYGVIRTLRRAAAGRLGVVYASLPAMVDVLFLRIGGAGIGNCFFAYFHAVLLAERTGQKMIAPAWGNLGVGVFLRDDHSRRRYGRMFVPHGDEMTSLTKAWMLATRWRGRRVVCVGPGSDPASLPVGQGLSVVRLDACWFGELVHHRAMVRRRLLDVIAIPLAAPAWGASPYIAVHVRLGDFAQPTTPVTANAVNTRIPMGWYEFAIGQAQRMRPDLPVRLFSDGQEYEVAALLAIPGVSLERSGSDIEQLIAMASASLFVGSNSTFSHWAAFLGDMSTIWATAPAERLGSDATMETVLNCP